MNRNYVVKTDFRPGLFLTVVKAEQFEFETFLIKFKGMSQKMAKRNESEQFEEFAE
jgi:hypothetical protein